MPRRLFRFYAFAAWVACGVMASAQQQLPTRQPTNPAPVTFGRFTEPLSGPWKFQPGDSPVEAGSGKKVWAAPDFDDRSWAAVDLTPPPGSYDATNGSSGRLPGWTARGYPATAGYAWYRLRTTIRNQDPSAPAQLALKMPASVDDAYQLYANGQFIGEFGHFSAGGVRYYPGQPRAFPLPPDFHDGPLTLAIRFYMAPSSLTSGHAAGGLHAAPILGQASAIRAMAILSRNAVFLFAASFAVEGVVLILVTCLVFVLLWLDRTERAYLWLGIECTAILIYSFTLVSTETTEWISWPLSAQILALVSTVVPVFWVLFFAAWFRLEGMSRLYRIVWPLAALSYLCSETTLPPLSLWMVGHGAPHWLFLLDRFADTPLMLLLLWVGYLGIRKNRPEGLLALPAILLVAAGHLQWIFNALKVPAGFRPFGVDVRFFQLGTIATLLMFTVRLLQRFFLSQRESDRLQQEMEQARQVQQLLVPEALPVLSGLRLESEYRPSRHVGGDFFQILAREDESLLLIIGDVSGKGLKAAMLVSMIVGALRAVVEQTQEPLQILEGLNRHMCGRIGHQFATCLVVRIAAGGACVVANAGHLAPYYNGCEVSLAGSVPLGLVEEAEFEQVRLTLERGDRLVMITDGIVEAQDAKRQLFGFERTTEIMMRNDSAAAVAAAAQSFGQEDDITVLSATVTESWSHGDTKEVLSSQSVAAGRPDLSS